MEAEKELLEKLVEARGSILGRDPKNEYEARAFLAMMRVYEDVIKPDRGLFDGVAHQLRDPQALEIND
jgi:hypothetical protein